MASHIHVNMNKRAKLHCAIACNNAAEFKITMGKKTVPIFGYFGKTDLA